jgi:hypothetical protein
MAQPVSQIQGRVFKVHGLERANISPRLAAQGPRLAWTSSAVARPGLTRTARAKAHRRASDALG